jgi:hypothetical protein
MCQGATDLGREVGPKLVIRIHTSMDQCSCELTNLTKLSDILLGVRSGLTGSIGAPADSSLLFRSASIHGVRIRISVIALYTPSVAVDCEVWNGRLERSRHLGCVLCEIGRKMAFDNRIAGVRAILVVCSLQSRVLDRPDCDLSGGEFRFLSGTFSAVSGIASPTIAEGPVFHPLLH